MGLKHSKSIFGCNFSLIYKVILYYAFVTLAVGGIAVAILKPSMASMMVEVVETNIFYNIGEALRQVLNGSISFQNAYEVFLINFKAIFAIISDNSASLSWIYLIIVFIGFIYRFMIGLSTIVIGDTINMFMTSKVKYGFSSNFIKNFRQAVKFSFATTIVSYFTNALIYLALFYITNLLFSFMSILALPLMLMLSVTVFGLKFALLSSWMPTYLCENLGVWKSLTKSFGTMRITFRSAFLASIFLYFVVYVIILSTIFVTFGLSLLISSASALVILKSLELVYYFMANKKNYYIDRYEIIDTTTIILG